MQENQPKDSVTEQTEIEQTNQENLSETEKAAATAPVTEAEKIAQLEKELAEAKDQILRSCAELSNQQRRAREELQNAYKYAINKFATELLSVKDSLEMALLDQSNQFDSLKMGVDLTLKQLVSAFDKAQIAEIIPTSGDKLDPHRHQAMSTEASDQEPNSIVRVLQKGYLIADRVLRPALVVVAKPAEQVKNDTQK